MSWGCKALEVAGNPKTAVKLTTFQPAGHWQPWTYFQEHVREISPRNSQNRRGVLVPYYRSTDYFLVLIPKPACARGK